MGRNQTDSKETKGRADDDLRLYISYPEEIRSRLEEIRKAGSHSSMSELFRHAILFYVAAYEEHKKGSALLFRDINGEVERLKLF